MNHSRTNVAQWWTASRTLVAGLVVVLVIGCQGRPSTSPPIHLNPNMDDQEKFEPYEANPIFSDSAAMRTPPEGTVARGTLVSDSARQLGLLGESLFVAHVPMDITMPLLERGQERFNIFCSPCHGRLGDGRGIIVQRGYVPPPSFHDERLRNVADGYIFNVITNGIRNMKSYRHQVPVDDRWAIVAYVRALQRSQNATIDDVPQEKRSQLMKR